MKIITKKNMFDIKPYLDKTKKVNFKIKDLK